MRFVYLLLLLLLSCNESEISKDIEILDDAIIENFSEESDMSADSSILLIVKSKWVCHHPNSDMHNHECIEESFPDGCYVEGDYHKFCWLLYKDDCSNPLNEDMLESCRNVGYL